MFTRTLSRFLMLALFAATMPLLAGGEWYDDYESGKNNCDEGNYGTCISKMNAAIGKKPKSDENARSYGMNFVKYTPYYYLGLAYLQQGNMEKANKNFQIEAEYGVIYKTTNSGSFKLMSKQASAVVIANATPKADPEDERKKKEEEERLKKEREDIARQKADLERLQAAAAAAPPPTPAAGSQTRFSPPPVATRPAPPSNPGAAVIPTTAPLPVVAPPVTSAVGTSEMARTAVKKLLEGEFGSAVVTLENQAVANQYKASPGYFTLIAYSYYLRSFTQPDKKSEFDEKAISNVKTAARTNPSFAPDNKFFPPKFIKFYQDNI